MRRYDKIFGILLILSIIDFALAAPIRVQNKCQACVDVVHIPKDEIAVLGKRVASDEDNVEPRTLQPRAADSARVRPGGGEHTIVKPRVVERACASTKPRNVEPRILQPRAADSARVRGGDCTIVKLVVVERACAATEPRNVEPRSSRPRAASVSRVQCGDCTTAGHDKVAERASGAAKPRNVEPRNMGPRASRPTTADSAWVQGGDWTIPEPRVAGSVRF